MKKVTIEELEENLYALNKWAKIYRDEKYSDRSSSYDLRNERQKCLIGRTKYEIVCTHYYDESRFHQCYDCWQDFLEEVEEAEERFYNDYGELLELREFSSKKDQAIYNRLVEIDLEFEKIQEAYYEAEEKETELYLLKDKILTHFFKPLNLRTYTSHNGWRIETFPGFYYYQTKNRSFHLPEENLYEDVPEIPGEPFFVQAVPESELPPLEEVLEFLEDYENYEITGNEIAETYPGDAKLIDEFVSFAANYTAKSFKKLLDNASVADLNNKVDGCFDYYEEKHTCEESCLISLASNLGYYDYFGENFVEELSQAFVDSSEIGPWMEWRGFDMLSEIWGMSIMYDDFGREDIYNSFQEMLVKKLSE